MKTLLITTIMILAGEVNAESMYGNEAGPSYGSGNYQRQMEQLQQRDYQEKSIQLQRDQLEEARQQRQPVRVYDRQMNPYDINNNNPFKN